MSDSRISPCPFCGSPAAPRHDKPTEYPADWTWQVACQDFECGAVGPLADTEGKAVSAWNERA